MNETFIFEVHGEPTDGTWMSDYCDLQIIAAKTEAEALEVAYNDGVLHEDGHRDKWNANKIGIALKEGSEVISSHYTRDY